MFALLPSCVRACPAFIHPKKNGLKADEWLRAALEACGGRGGGRATSAQGQAADAGEMGKGMAAAEAFISG